jgi:hypothetical protein
VLLGLLLLFLSLCCLLLLAVDCSCSLLNAVLVADYGGTKYAAGTGTTNAGFESEEGELGDWAAF